MFHQYGNQCLQGHDVCPELTHYVAFDTKLEWVSVGTPVEGCSSSGMRTGIYRTEWTKRQVAVSEPYLARLYNKVAEAAIESWKAEDRERRSFEWKLEQQAILDGTYGRYGAEFDPVARDVFYQHRPDYYLVALGVNPFTFKRVALIRIPSTSIHLFVDVASAVQEVSKNARRKAMRHGKVANGALMEQIHQLCQSAVMDWWTTRK